MNRHRLLPCLVGAALVFVGSTSAAQDKPEKTKEECIAANESAQTMRAGGKLREAKSQLLVCIDKTCPSVIRDDCAERLDALERAIPTIVFTAKGTAGVDLTNVVVTMDGVKIAERLDASAIAVDPGEHTFEFASEGYPSITKKILVREGAKGHQELVDFAPGSNVVPPSGGGGGPTPAADTSSGDTQRIVAYALGGAGIVGLGLGTIFGLKASSTYKEAESHCTNGPNTCTPDGVSGSEDAHTQATISTISFVAGGLLVGGALVLYFTAPPSASTTARTTRRTIGLSPTAGPGAAGLRLGGTF